MKDPDDIVKVKMKMLKMRNIKKNIVENESMKNNGVNNKLKEGSNFIFLMKQ